MNLSHDVIEGFYRALEKSRRENGALPDAALTSMVLKESIPIEQFLERVEADYRRAPRGLSIEREVKPTDRSTSKTIKLVAKDHDTLLQWEKSLFRFGAYKPSPDRDVIRWDIGFFNPRGIEKNVDGWYPSIEASHGWKVVRERTVGCHFVGYSLIGLPELAVLDMIGQLARNIGIAEAGLLARMYDGSV